MNITELLTDEEMKVMDKKASITGQPDREFLKQFIGDHYKELSLTDLLLWEIAMGLYTLNFTNTIPERIKEENWQ